MAPANRPWYFRIAPAWAALVVAGAIQLSAQQALPPREARVFAVTTWDADPSCSQVGMPEWEALSRAWYEEITDVGSTSAGVCVQGHCDEAYGKGPAQIDGPIANSDFADPDAVGLWGKDSAHLEKGAAVLVAWHGRRLVTSEGSVYAGAMRVDGSGAPGLAAATRDDCTLRSDEMRIGDDGLDFLHFSSCHSMDDRLWSAWTESYDGAHQIDGFHGYVFVNDWQEPDYEGFAFDAFYMSIAEAWLDNMYRPEVDGSGEDAVDQCPVAHAVGKDLPDAWNRISTERYDEVYEDPVGADSAVVFYIEGCDPEDGLPLE